MIALLVAVSTAAHADTPDDAKAAMVDYFDGERLGGNVLVGMGLAGIVTGAYLQKEHCKIRQGIALPLLAIGAAHLAAGIYISAASDQRVDTFDNEIDREGQVWVERERDRMAGVSTQFTVLKIVEGALIAGGIGLAVYGWKKQRPKLEGIGVGIAIEAAMTLGFDIWASARASDYRDKLDDLTLTSPRLAGIGPRLRFTF